jgi:hypothetical protein
MIRLPILSPLLTLPRFFLPSLLSVHPQSVRKHLNCYRPAQDGSRVRVLLLKHAFKGDLSMKIRNWLLMSLASGLALTLSAQQAVPPPQPTDNGPSLAVTMQLLQAKLNEQGKMSWTTHYHDSADNTNWIYQFTFEAGKVVADAPACNIAYHYIIVRDGVKISDSDASFNLHDVQDVTLMTGDQRQNNNDTAAGHTTWNAKVDPPVFDLIVRGQGKDEYYFFFFNEDTANRVTKAMGHAVELCGGSRGSY